MNGANGILSFLFNLFNKIPTILKIPPKYIEKTNTATKLLKPNQNPTKP